MMTQFNNIKNFFFSQKNLLIFSLSFLLIRLIISHFFVKEIISAEDFDIAQNLVNGNGYTWAVNLGPTAIKVPAYPLFLSFFILLFGSSALSAIVIFQHIIISTVPFLLVKLGESSGRIKYGYISGWLFLIHPSYFYYPNVVEVTNIFIPLFIIFLIYTLKAINYNSGKEIWTAGLLAGVLMLTQPIVAPLIAALTLFLFFKKKMKSAFIIIILTIAVMSPWIIRNYIEFNKFIPTKTPIWLNFYLGWLPENHGSEKYDLIQEKDKILVDSLIKANASEAEMEKHYKNIVISTIQNNPSLYFGKTFYQMGIYWYITPRYFNNSEMSFILLRKMPVIILNILFFAGLIKLITYDSKAGAIIVSIFFYFTIVYGLTCVANIRYKIDIEWLEFFAVSALFLGRNSMQLSAKFNKQQNSVL